MHAPSAPRWYLLRHARPLVAEGVCYGQSDIVADAQATLQAAHSFARHWQITHGGQEACVQLLSSPLRRCLHLAQSLQPLLTASGCEMQYRTHGALAEMDFGNWEGQPWNALPAAVWQDWQADFAHYRPGGGESTAHLLGRVRTAAGFTARWLRRHDEAVAIWVTHAGVMRALHWLQQHGGGLPAAAIQWSSEGACGHGQWLALDADAVRALSGAA